MTTKHRWTCPECGAGKLLGSRPRRNATARFCLSCSERTGVLVERVCPVLNKRRDRKRDSQEQKRERKVERARDAETVSGVHIPSEMHRMCRVLFRTKVFPMSMVDPKHIDLKLTIVRAKKKTRSVCNPEAWQRWIDQQETCASGRAGGWAISLKVGCRCPRYKVLALLLHELCHIAAPPEEGHGDRFATILAEAARELWGIKLETIHEYAYDLDRELEKKLAAHLEESKNKKE